MFKKPARQRIAKLQQLWLPQLHVYAPILYVRVPAPLLVSNLLTPAQKDHRFPRITRGRGRAPGQKTDRHYSCVRRALQAEPYPEEVHGR
jgi:hypothetical protein